MPTIEEMSKMKAKEVYGLAVRSGIEVAVKHGSVGLHPNLDEWYSSHPEFSDPLIKVLVNNGAAESYQEILEMVAGLSNTEVVNIG